MTEDKIVHKWNIHVERGGAPHLCKDDPMYFHPSRDVCCTIHNEKINCEKCLKILKEYYGQI
jgi:hypothetical protein